MKKKRVYGYTRTATTKQAKEFNSDEYQAVRIKKYCTGNGLELVDTFAETATSRMTMLDQMFSKCRRKDKIDAIVVISKDRLSRDDFELGIFEGLLKKKGIELIALNEL